MRREAYRIGLWERPADGKGGIHSIAVHVDRKDAPRAGKGPPGREGPGAAPRPQALAGPLQTGMKVLMRAEEAGMCEQAPPDGDEGVPDAGRRRSAEDLHEQRPDASGDRGERRERGNPPRPPVLGLLKGADADILHGQPLDRKSVV